MEHSHHGVMIAEAAEVIDSKYQEVEQIQVLARQWSWEFRYGNGTGNVTSTELHLPNNRRIKLVLHSEDVLHGLFIPAFRVKQDVILGVILILNLRRSVKEISLTGFAIQRYLLRSDANGCGGGIA